jgi:hypothetical protein
VNGHHAKSKTLSGEKKGKKRKAPSAWFLTLFFLFLFTHFMLWKVMTIIVDMYSCIICAPITETAQCLRLLACHFFLFCFSPLLNCRTFSWLLFTYFNVANTLSLGWWISSYDSLDVDIMNNSVVKKANDESLCNKFDRAEHAVV